MYLHTLSKLRNATKAVGLDNIVRLKFTDSGIIKEHLNTKILDILDNEIAVQTLSNTLKTYVTENKVVELDVAKLDNVEYVYTSLFENGAASVKVREDFEKYLMANDKMYELYLQVNMSAIDAYEVEENKLAEANKTTPLLFERDASSPNNISIQKIHAQKPELKAKFDAFAQLNKVDLFISPTDIDVDNRPDYKLFYDSASPFRRLINDINIQWIKKTKVEDVLRQIYCVFAGSTFSWEHKISRYLRQYDEGVHFTGDRDKLKCASGVDTYAILLWIALGVQFFHMIMFGIYVYTYKNNPLVVPYLVLYASILAIIIITIFTFLVSENLSTQTTEVYVGVSATPTPCTTLNGTNWETMFSIIIMCLIVQLLFDVWLSRDISKSIK